MDTKAAEDVQAIWDPNLPLPCSWAVLELLDSGSSTLQHGSCEAAVMCQFGLQQGTLISPHDLQVYIYDFLGR